MEATDRIKVLLGKAFDAGYSNSAELKDQIIEELIQQWNEMGAQVQDAYRIFKVEELRQLPVGAVVHHLSRGRGFVMAKPDGTKCMQFEKEGSPVRFTNNGDPWDRPMKLLHATEK